MQRRLPLALHLFLYMQDLFYFVASVVLVECGYFMWLLIDRERSMRQDESREIGLLDSIREEYTDG